MNNPVKSLTQAILNAHILIVDDQSSNVELLSQMLQESGYTRVESTMNPQEVGTLHRENAYDLVLLDLQMPVMDGFAVMEELKSSMEGGFLPVIAITAQPSHKLRALQAGARDFVSKPFDVTELRTRIHNTLEVCLLYSMLQDHNSELERRVEERTAQLRESEARFRALTELASDWYWEQDDTGVFTKVTGPVLDMLGIQGAQPAGVGPPVDPSSGGWNSESHGRLKEYIAQRQPFLDLELSRTGADGSMQWFQVSGEPMFDRWNKFIGVRGIGLDTTYRH
jgi:PAS domain S-box-containing protein